MPEIIHFSKRIYGNDNKNNGKSKLRHQLTLATVGKWRESFLRKVYYQTLILNLLMIFTTNVIHW